MEDQKIDNLLNLAVDATSREREKSLNLNVGYDAGARVWDVIVKYTGNILEIEQEDISVVRLLNEYAVVTLPEKRLASFANLPEIEYVEKPKRLFFTIEQGRVASCASRSVTEQYGVTGKGILVGLVDSGIDYRHPDFRKEDGTTRIVSLWDQTLQGRPPEGYRTGTEFTREELNQILAGSDTTDESRRIPSRDLSGHGTQVAGIAAGNGRASGGVQKGMAWESELVVVKLGNPREDSFPRTTELIQGIDYLVRQSLKLGMPMAINISFGNNYGSHRGDSLLEAYIYDVANLGRTVICIGTGNNGKDALHTSGSLETGQEHSVQLAVSTYELSLNVQLWKAYTDEMEVFIEHPSGERIGPLDPRLGPQRYYMYHTQLLIYYGEPSPHSLLQEIYIDFIPLEDYVDSGIWQIILRGRKIVQGRYDLWLPGGGVLQPQTGFYFPTPDNTLTVPSTAGRVITVGAYDARYLAYADFSGRGSQDRLPDLVAPGVEIETTAPGGGYISVTGTSFAAPFVTGAAALLMEWGIVQENDRYLYGEKVRAYLQRGAKPLPGFDQYPNRTVGFGTLCLRDSFPM